jgi:hypothetical protein
VLHTGKHMSALPGLRFPATAPLFPTRVEFVEYLRRYATTFELPIRANAEVVKVERAKDGWLIRTRSGEELGARAVVVATGIASNPVIPEIHNRTRFRGRVRHSIEYRNPADAKGRRILVVGRGEFLRRDCLLNSAGPAQKSRWRFATGRTSCPAKSWRAHPVHLRPAGISATTFTARHCDRAGQCHRDA